MIDWAGNKLSVNRQCGLLGLCRATLYYKKKPVNLNDLELMQRIDEIYTAYPFMGSRQITSTLKRQKMSVNRKRVQRLMRRMGLCAVVPGPHTSRGHPEHVKYPYLLRDLAITRPNQVWATDITYIPMAKGFMYLCAIVDWHSRKVLAWRVSNTLETKFCLSALKEALFKFGKPEIFNTDQGAQFTSEEFTGMLKHYGIKISMDGKGRALDNVFVERLWRTVKYEHLYLNPSSNGTELKQGLEKYFDWYNQKRPHSSLDSQTPDEVYFGLQTQQVA